jgi:hypothetical protein
MKTKEKALSLLDKEQFLKLIKEEGEKRHPYEGGGLMAKIKANAEQQNFIEPAMWAYELLTKNIS